MTGRPSAAQLWGVPTSGQVDWRVAVISEDEALADRVAEALERDGLVVALEGCGAEIAAVDEANRPPTMLILHADRGERPLEHALQWAGRRLPHAVVIVLLPEAKRHDVGLLLSMGADGILAERDIEVALGPVARAAAAGHVSVPAELRHTIQRPALSHRERQILGLAVAGLTNAQIAQRFFIAESTVKTHLSSAFRRLGVHSRREAAALIFASDDVLRRSVLATLRLSDEFPARRDEP
jgi:DNA-binding NarL/FixJ family response regulator